MCEKTSKCPDEWIEIAGKCFYISNKAMKFENAKHCRSKNARLFEPRSESMNKQVRVVITNKTGEDTMSWIGITDKQKEGE